MQKLRECGLTLAEFLPVAGRKQHYIPQFLLRGFGSAGGGKKLQVRVVSRDREFVVATDGIAAQREFYSRLDEGPDSLDGLITNAETEYSAIYQSLQALEHGAVADAQQVAYLLSHLAMRGRHLRDTFSLAGQTVLTEAVRMLADPSTSKLIMGIAGEQPSAQFIKTMDEAYHKDKKKFGKAKISRFTVRRMAFEYAKENWAQISTEMAPFLLMALNIDASEAAQTGQKKALQSSLSPRLRAETLAKLDWKIVDVSPHVLVLPDSVAIGHISEIGPVPISYVSSEDVAGAIFPLSSTKAVCAGVYLDESVLKRLLLDFQKFAATCSWNFVVLDPTLPIDPDIQLMMGSAVTGFFQRKIAEAMQELLLESMA